MVSLALSRKLSYTLLLCPMPQKKGEIVQSLLFVAGSDPQPQSALFHSDVEDTQEEALHGDVQQETLFQPVALPARRTALTPVQHVQSEPMNPADLTQTGMFEEVEQGEIRTIEDCFVTMKPIIEVTQ